ncbi:Ankyrin repeat domain-containing protein 26 [Fukomys damarensis]|uniref:Ankyrin repeat domain-containing protein 26 n=1 Tax=Fukomys damarensis TaxID=885580 RepID=A0A091DTY8_FUKDA|nr:Ankyrin repeat domain-containing protein 26 [Fukomys damarensis]
MGKLHKAASVGDTAKVEQRLMLRKSGVNDRDKKHRTALHFACVYGHPEVVTLLVEKKCDIDAHDRENSTALIKAVQYHQEECATILLEHSANPNVADANGNTALHYAVYWENSSIAAKLLSHHADTEAKNKDDLTPHSLAVKENKQQVAELLIKEKENIHALDEPGRFSNKRDPFDSSVGDDDNFDDMNLPKVNLAELWTAAHQSGEKQAKYGTEESRNTTPLDDRISDGESKDNVETHAKTSDDVESFSQSSILSPSHGKEKKYLEDIEIAQEKTDNIQRTIKLNVERIFQHHEQLNSLTVVKTVPNSKLESAKQIKERLDTETESHDSRLAAAVQDYDGRQPSKRDMELAFQRARDECTRLQDKLNFDVSNLKDSSKMLSQQLSQAERNFSSLEVELHHKRDALEEKISALEQARREQNQALCQMKEIKRVHQNEQIKVNTCMQRQESLEGRLSQLQP